MRILGWGRVLASGVFAGLLVQCQTPAKETGGSVKRRIAVFEFDNAARTSTPYPFLKSNAPDIGKAAADLLITRLVQDGSVLVIERDALNKLLAEQSLSNSDRSDPQTAAKLGKILGVDAIVLGSVTRYDFDDKTSRTGGRPGFMGFGASSPKIRQDLSAHVEIDARVVSPETAQVLTASQGEGVINRQEKANYSEIADMMSGKGEVHDSLMSEAMDKAVSQLCEQLEQSLPKVPIHSVVINGLVADASDPVRLILNVGSRDGVKQGDRLQIWRAGKEIRDPATGRVLTREDLLLGDAVVNTVNEGFSIASYQGATVKIGDIAKGPVKK